MAENIIFDESHYFMCTNGLKPARMKSNQTVLYREDGNYYLTVYSLKCKRMDFSCRWAALVMAFVAAAIALLLSCPVGWVLLAALGGAAAGACLGSAICGDMAAIMRIWVVIKADASISGYDMVSNKKTPQLECGILGGVISYVPNVKTSFDEYFIFAYNTLGAGLEGFMYAYGFRGAGLLLTAPKTFLCNFAANYLKSWSLTGIAFRGAFAEIARKDTYYNSPTEGHDREKERTAFTKAFFFERAVAENIHGAVTSDEKNPWLKSLNIAKSVAPILAMGGIPGGKTGDATKADVVAAAKETAPVKMAEQIKKGVNAAKEYRSQLRSQSKGTGAKEGSGFDYQKYKLKQGEKLGDFGERIVRDMLEAKGFDEFFQVQNKSGNGVDIVCRNSSNGEVKVIEVKSTQKSTYWNGGNTKELPLSKDQQAGGRAYSKSRLDRATKGEDGWKSKEHKPIRKNAQDAQKTIKQAKKEGKLSYEKYDVYVDKDGTVLGEPQQRPW